MVTSSYERLETGILFCYYADIQPLSTTTIINTARQELLLFFNQISLKVVYVIIEKRTLSSVNSSKFLTGKDNLFNNLQNIFFFHKFYKGRLKNGIFYQDYDLKCSPKKFWVQKKSF